MCHSAQRFKMRFLIVFLGFFFSVVNSIGMCRASYQIEPELSEDGLGLRAKLFCQNQQLSRMMIESWKPLVSIELTLDNCTFHAQAMEAFRSLLKTTTSLKRIFLSGNVLPDLMKGNNIMESCEENPRFMQSSLYTGEGDKFVLVEIFFDDQMLKK